MVVNDTVFAVVAAINVDVGCPCCCSVYCYFAAVHVVDIVVVYSLEPQKMKRARVHKALCKKKESLGK